MKKNLNIKDPQDAKMSDAEGMKEKREEQQNAEAAAPEEKQDKKPEKSQEEILKEENAKLKDHMLRALADAENTRKRAEKDVEEAVKYGITGFARDMISVLEDLNRAEQNIPEDGSELIKKIGEGVSMTKRELMKIFERHGIKRIDPVGQKFDHNFHQAVAQIEDGKNPPGTVLQVVQAGYVIRERLLRPAMVTVSKVPESGKEAGQPD